MRILFYTTFEVSPYKGGTERITSSISNGLRENYGYKCYSAFSCKIEDKFQRSEFDGYLHVNGMEFDKKLRNFIIDNDIDVIVNQGAFYLAPKMRKAIEGLYGKHLVLVHHFNPGAEEHFFNLRNLYFEAFHHYRIKAFFRLCLFPILKKEYVKKKHLEYKQGYENADLVVLLSERFKSAFMSYGNLKEGSKFREIHNSLSYNCFLNMKQYDEKEKEVLIVSRLDEEQKRILLALKIWEIIEKDGRYVDWRLTIVGHGDMDEPRYKHYVKYRNLKRVSFLGMQEPSRFYKRATIFMMTSLYEGWGLTLTEAQQFGCIPLAFNSYASLLDIITDGVNGYIIKEGDIDEYVDRMMALMDNIDLRKDMAAQCVISSHRFEISKVTAQWHQLINSLVNFSAQKCIQQLPPPPSSRRLVLLSLYSMSKDTYVAA